MLNYSSTIVQNFHRLCNGSDPGKVTLLIKERPVRKYSNFILVTERTDRKSKARSSAFWKHTPTKKKKVNKIRLIGDNCSKGQKIYSS